MMEYVCENCMEGTIFKRFVSDNGNIGPCSFCSPENIQTRVINYDLLLEHICEKVEGEFETYNNEYDDDEGNPVVPVLDSFDLMGKIGLNIENEDLFGQIREHFSESDWVSYEAMAPTEDQVFSGGWSRFKDLVMRLGPDAYKDHFDPGRSEDDPEHIHIAHVPGMLVGIVHNLVVKLPSGTSIWRVRVLSSDPQVPDDFTSPPKALAKQPNRMSPVGISMFYGAEDYETAVAETVDHSRLQGHTVYGIQFETTCDFQILDLTQIYGQAHFNFQKRFRKFGPRGFLEEFVQDLSQPIERDGNERKEYIPTQIFTEQVRSKMTSKTGDSILGIKFTSSRTGGICYVIFAEQDQCLDDVKDRNELPHLLRAVPESLQELIGSTGKQSIANSDVSGGSSDEGQ